MSLIIDTNGCPDGADPELARSIGFAAMSVDLTVLTAETLPEWLFRLRYLERVGLGAIRLLTIEELASCLGLTTNVGPKSRTAWLNRINREVAHRVEQHVDAALKANV